MIYIYIYTHIYIYICTRVDLCIPCTEFVVVVYVAEKKKKNK